MVPRLYVLAVGGLVLAAALAAGYRWAYGHGHDACARDHDQAVAVAKDQDHAAYVAAVAWGSQVSETLAQSQMQIQSLRKEHDHYARSITGTCPDGLRVLHDASAAGTNISEPASEVAGGTGTVAASAVGEAVAENYAACRENLEQLEAWIRWCRGTPGCDPVKPDASEG